MQQCINHPFRQTSIYCKGKLVCPLCIMPSEQQEQLMSLHNDILDLDYLNSLASSVKVPDAMALIDAVEGRMQELITNFEKTAHSRIDLIVSEFQGIIMKHLYQYRMQMEQCEIIRQDINKDELKKRSVENIEQIKNNLIHLQESQQSIDNIPQIEKSLTQNVKTFIQEYLNQMSSVNLNTFEQSLLANAADAQQVEPFQRDSVKEGRRRNEGSVQRSSFMINASFQVNLIPIEQIKRIKQQQSTPMSNKPSSILVNKNLLVIGTSSGTLQLMDQQQDEVYYTCQAHQQTVKILAQSSDFQFIASAAEDKLCLWKKHFNEDEAKYSLELIRDVEQHANILAIHFISKVVHKQFKSVNLLVVGGTDNVVRIWNYLDGEYLFTYVGHTGDIYSISYLRKNQMIISGSQDKSIRLWDASSFKLQKSSAKLMGHSDSVLGVIASDEENQIISCSIDRTVKVWDPVKAQVVRTINISGQIVRMVFFQIGQVVVLTNDAKLRFIDYKISVQIHEITSKKKLQSFAVDDEQIFTIEDSDINLYY